jgi:hypothetical protein
LLQKCKDIYEVSKKRMNGCISGCASNRWPVSFSFFVAVVVVSFSAGISAGFYGRATKGKENEWKNDINNVLQQRSE